MRFGLAWQGSFWRMRDRLRVLGKQIGEKSLLNSGAIGAASGAACQVETKCGALGRGRARIDAPIEQAARLMTIHNSVVLSNGKVVVARRGRRRLTLFCSFLRIS
jgi:hypothetical protein